MQIKFFNELLANELTEIATLHFNQWSPLNASLTLADKIEEFTKEYARYSDKLPCGFALYDEGKLVGFCRLKSINLKKYPQITPWISSLLILEKHKGYGKYIVDSACDILKKIGYKEVYVYTDQAPDFYKKLDFQYVGEVEKNDKGMAELFKKEL